MTILSKWYQNNKTMNVNILSHRVLGFPLSSSKVLFQYNINSTKNAGPAPENLQ